MRIRCLVFEMTHSSGEHGNAIGVAIVNRKLIFDAATGLHNGVDSRFVGNFYAVWEREESITSHHRALQVEAEAVGLFNGLL